MSRETRSSTNWSSLAACKLDPEEELELPVDEDDEPELGNEPVIMAGVESSEKNGIYRRWIMMARKKNWNLPPILAMSPTIIDMKSLTF